jgi:transposase
VRYSTLFTIRTLGCRVAALDAELVELKAVMRPLIDRTAPGLLSMYGVGHDVAAKLLVAAGDNPDRLRSEAAFANLCGVAPLEASSGKTVRHRLNRGGNRQANKALYHVVITRMASHRRTTSNGDEPRASRPARSSPSSSATWPAKHSSTSGRPADRTAQVAA